MTLSIRHQILQKMVAKYTAVQSDNPIPTALFSVVALGPLSDADHRKRYAIGVVAGAEKEKFLYPYIECMLTVNIEFRITQNRGDSSPADMGETMLTRVKQLVMSNRTWDGLAIDTKVIGSQVDLDTYLDQSVVGLCVCEVQFRHSHLDPADAHPDT